MYTEFLAATIEACGRIEEDRIAEAFDRYVEMVTLEPSCYSVL
jgi:hypothetical protein